MQSRPDTQVVDVPRCIECARPWLLESERWRLKLLEGDEPEPVLYCPDCHQREFDS